MGDIDKRYNFGEGLKTTSEVVAEAPVSAAKTNEIDRTISDEQIARIVENAVSEVINESVFVSKVGENEKTDSEGFLTDEEDIASRIGNDSASSSSGTSKPSKQSSVVLSKTIEQEAKPKPAKSKIGKLSDALNGLSDDVRAAQTEIYDRSLLDINRSVI